MQGFGHAEGNRDPHVFHTCKCRSPKHSKPVVTISDCTRQGYWLVAITCKDRNKLLFDTVCTLADMDYDVYHATVDSCKGIATQEYYIKPRWGNIGALPSVAVRQLAEAGKHLGKSAEQQDPASGALCALATCCAPPACLRIWTPRADCCPM